MGDCGNARTPVTDPSVALTPTGFHRLIYPGQGLAISAPNNWIVTRSHAPLVATVSSGDAIVALWRFPRSAAVPVGTSELELARQALIKTARQRDRTLDETRGDETPGYETSRMKPPTNRCRIHYPYTHASWRRLHKKE